MANGVFNIAKGRVVELYNRVKSNDPANSALIVVLFTGTETDDNIQDADTLAALLATSLSEATFTNYARKTLTDSDLAALPSPDDSSNRYDIDLSDLVWVSAGGASNETLTRMAICYDSDATAGTDANIVPLTYYDVHDASASDIVTNGENLTIAFDAAGFFRAA